VITLDRATAYALRAALIAVLRIVEDALRLPDEERACRPPRRKRAA
jgi:hypothetical protein